MKIKRKEKKDLSKIGEMFLKKIVVVFAALIVMAVFQQTGIHAYAIDYLITEDGEYEYVVETESDGNQIARLERYLGSKKEVIIPSKVNGIPVYAINGAFYENETIESVVIPDTVTIIQSYTFYNCKNLKKVEMPDSIVEIRKNAFAGCISLEKIYLSDNITKIGTSAFSDCYSLTSVKLPKDITEIGKEMFFECKNLESVTMGDKVTQIDQGAFMYCSKLKSIHLSNTLQSIGLRAFRDCNKILEFAIPDSVTTIIEYLGSFPNNATYYISENSELYTEFKNNNFTVVPKINISTSTVNPVPDQIYTGKDIYPALVVKDGNTQLTKGIDYTVQFQSNKEIGMAKAVIKGIGKYTNSISCTFHINPAKVGGLKQSGYSEISAKLQWDATPGNVDGYEVYGYDSKLKEYVKVRTSTSLSWIDKGLSASTTKKYQVRAYKKVNGKIYYGKFSKTLTAATSPAKVKNFSWNDSKSTKIQVKWSKPSEKISGYQIYKYNAKSNTYKFVKSLTDTTRKSWTNNYLKSNEEHKYRIRSYITVNGTTYYGELSDEVKATTSCAMPKYRLTSDKKGQITVNWEPVAGAKRYVVFYKTEKNGTWRALTGSNTTGTTFTKKNLVSGKRYYFYVRAMKDYKGTEVKSGAYFKNKACR